MPRSLSAAKRQMRSKFALKAHLLTASSVRASIMSSGISRRRQGQSPAPVRSPRYIQTAVSQNPELPHIGKHRILQADTAVGLNINTQSLHIITISKKGWQRGYATSPHALFQGFHRFSWYSSSCRGLFLLAFSLEVIDDRLDGDHGPREDRCKAPDQDVAEKR